MSHFQREPAILSVCFRFSFQMESATSQPKVNEGSPGPGFVCDCHKKFEQLGIPVYISDENDYYGETQRAIAYERAFRLPGVLEINNEVTEYLRIEDNDLSSSFEQMAEVFPALWDYEENVLSFWMLDVLVEGLWTAQEAKMEFSHQKATLLWIAYFFNYIQRENPSRKQLFHHLKVLLFSSGVCHQNDGRGEDYSSTSEKSGGPILETHWSLPLPPSVNYYRHKKGKQLGDDGVPEDYESGEVSEPMLVYNSSSIQDNEKNISDMKVILDILYRIFARIYVYQHIQTVFHMMPSLETVQLPFSLKIPKPLAKTDIFAHSKTHVGKKASSTEKYNEDIEAEKNLLKNAYILPLEAAEEAKEYLKQPSSDRSVLWRNREDKNKK